MLIFFLDKFVKKWRLRPRVYVLIFVVGFLFMAFFSAWRERLNAARKANEDNASLRTQLETALQQSEPKLDGHIYAAWLSELDENSVEVLLLLTVRNQGAPSIARGWHLAVVALGMTQPSYGQLTHYAGAKGMVFYEPACNCDYILEQKAALYLRVQEDPIPTGAERSGYVTFKLPGLRKQMIDKQGTKFSLSFYDVRENRHEASLIYSGPHQPGIPIIPGVTLRPHDESRFRE